MPSPPQPTTSEPVESPGMCGRYVSPAESDLERLWQIRGTGDLFKAQYNVAPTMPVPIIYHSKRDNARSVMRARWGLIPT